MTKKPILRAFAGLLAAFALTACPETQVRPDFGYLPAALKPSEWNGVWKASNEEEAMRFHVSDAKNGQITITSVPDPKGKKAADDKPMLLTLRVASTKKNLYFATLLDKGKAGQTLTPYLVHRVDSDSLVLWTINNEAVAEAIKAGKLKGTVKPDKEGAHSLLDSDPANYQALVQPRFWTWMSPTMVQRREK